ASVVRPAIGIALGIARRHGFGYGQCNPSMRKRYNKVDAPARYTVQVYPKSCSAILISLDNKGIWNLRSAIWPRQYLGQQLYIRVWNNEQSLYKA
ncbi:hypothetical protein Droror1_Dr00025093, partial [Drosera rotundifolia]